MANPAFRGIADRRKADVFAAGRMLTMALDALSAAPPSGEAAAARRSSSAASVQPALLDLPDMDDDAEPRIEIGQAAQRPSGAHATSPAKPVLENLWPADDPAHVDVSVDLQAVRDMVRRVVSRQTAGADAACAGRVDDEPRPVAPTHGIRAGGEPAALAIPQLRAPLQAQLAGPAC
jgi:hypothetical protein